jgi:hypothetical protein
MPEKFGARFWIEHDHAGAGWRALSRRFRGWGDPATKTAPAVRWHAQGQIDRLGDAIAALIQVGFARASTEPTDLGCT